MGVSAKRTIEAGRAVRVSGLACGLVALGSLLAAAPPAFAQSKVGTTFGQFLMIEPSARFAGMGNAGVSFYDGLDAAYFNPAAVVGESGREAQFTYASWFAGIGFSHVGAALPFPNLGTFYASATVLQSGNIPVRTVSQPLGTGEQFGVTDLAIGLGYGRDLGGRVAVGLQANYVQESIWNTSASAWTINLGTLYRVRPDGLHIGASMTNFGTDATFDGRDLRIAYDQDPETYGDNGTLPGEKFTGDYSVPVLFRVGVGMPYRINENTRLRVAVDAFHANDNAESVSGGGEVVFKESLALRAGWQNLFLNDSEMGPTLGAGFHGRFQEVRYDFDYAWGDYGRLGDAHRLTLGVQF